MEENQRRRRRGGGTLGGIQVNNPFPGEPRGLKLVRGQLLFDAETVGSSESFAAGSGFRVEWKKTQERGGGGSCLLSVFHHSQPHTAAWSTAQGTGSFISAALGDGEIVESRGSFALHDHIELLCKHQTIEQISSWNPPPHPHPTSTAIGTAAASSASSCGIQNNSMSSSMFSAQEELLRSRIDADGTLLSNEGPCVLVTGCLYNNANVAMEQLKLQAELRKQGTKHGAGDGPPFYYCNSSSNDGETEERRRRRRSWMGFFLHDGLLQPIVGVRYYLVFCERRDHHLGFHVWLDRPQALDHHRCRRSSISSSSPQFLSYKRLALSNSSYMESLQEEEEEEEEKKHQLLLLEEEEEQQGGGRLGFNLERLRWLWSKEPSSAFARAAGSSSNSRLRTTTLDLQHMMRKKQQQCNFQVLQKRENLKLVWRTTAASWCWWWSPARGMSPIAQQQSFLFKRWKKKWTFGGGSRRSSSTRRTTSSNNSSNILALLREQRGDDDDVQLPQFNRIQITYSSHKGERFYGFGEQFSHFDMKGKRVPILVQEQGLGRGDQPITAAANLVAHRCCCFTISSLLSSHHPSCIFFFFCSSLWRIWVFAG